MLPHGQVIRRPVACQSFKKRYKLVVDEPDYKQGIASFSTEEDCLNAKRLFESIPEKVDL